MRQSNDRERPCVVRVWLALEYKGIDYDTMFIDLQDKPKWFLEVVPKGLVPVAKIKDKILPESYAILKVRGTKLRVAYFLARLFCVIFQSLETVTVSGVEFSSPDSFHI